MIDNVKSTEPEQERIRDLEETIRRLRSEVLHWKKNHRQEVERARLLKDRLDMPVERVRAYELCKKLQEENEQLKITTSLRENPLPSIHVE